MCALMNAVIKTSLVSVQEDNPALRIAFVELAEEVAAHNFLY